MQELDIDDRVLYYLLSGMTYTEIANKYYFRQKYKFVHEVKKLLKKFNLKNRKQLAFFALTHGLVQIDMIGRA